MVVDGGEEAVCEAAILQVRLRHLPCTIRTTKRDKVKIAQSKGSVDQARRERLRSQRRECGMWTGEVDMESQRRRVRHGERRLRCQC